MARDDILYVDKNYDMVATKILDKRFMKVSVRI